MGVETFKAWLEKNYPNTLWSNEDWSHLELILRLYDEYTAREDVGKFLKRVEKELKRNKLEDKINEVHLERADIERRKIPRPKLR